jgi:uncharacterized protein
MPDAEEDTMTPQERQLIDDLFDRLAKLETSPRDPEAQAAIVDGLRRAPNAVYALVQTVLVQDEALKQAEAHIQELEERNQPQQQSGGFLDNMRDSLLGPSSSRGSVPNVRPTDSAGSQRPVWNTGQTGYQPDPRMGIDPRQGTPGGGFGGGGLFGGGNPGAGNPGGGGGSFLGTAAATAAGVIGGSMLMNSIRGMMGGGSHQQSFGDTASSAKSPWDNNQSSGNQSGSDLSRDAGLNDVGKSSNNDDNSRQSLADNSSYDQNNDDDYDNNDDDDYDGDDDGSDDSDFA